MVRILYGTAILAGSWFVAPKAWYAVRRFRPDMNLLMTVAVIGAVAIGEWFEAATVSFLFGVSLALEAWSVGRARRAIEALMELAPPMARLLENGVPKEVAPDVVAVGYLEIPARLRAIALDKTGAMGCQAGGPLQKFGLCVAAERDDLQAGERQHVGPHHGDPELRERARRPTPRR